MTDKLIDDCFAHDRKRLRHGEALAILKRRMAPVAASETVPLAEVAGRILAELAEAPRPVPAHTNAAVDGYSFAAADCDAGTGKELPVDGRAAAGHRLERTPAPGAAARIFTGAVMPPGHDTVVMQEDVEVRTAAGRTFVTIPAGLKRGANVRRAGEDVEAGETLLRAGAVLRPQGARRDGLDRDRRGRMLRPPQGRDRLDGRRGRARRHAVRGGQVYDANAPMLTALIASREPCRRTSASSPTSARR